MSNPYGITLDRAWTEWAGDYGVSPTVAAALFLMSEPRPQVTAKLAPGEFEQVIDIVWRWPGNCRLELLPPSKATNTSPDPPADSVSTDQSRRQSTRPESGKERGSTGNLFGIALDQALLRWAAAEDMTETVIAAVSLLHERSCARPWSLRQIEAQPTTAFAMSDLQFPEMGRCDFLRALSAG